MANFTLLQNPISSLPLHNSSLTLAYSPLVQLPRLLTNRKTRNLSTVVVRAGPGMNAYIFAFVFPMSLLAGTVYASIRIADKLDRDFLEELAINQAIRADEDDGDAEILEDEEPVRPRTRNRPKREADVV